MAEYYDLGRYGRKISTRSPEAQTWFDRGLIWCYAYHHQEAADCFIRAIEADSDCAVAYWGLAYVTGCNYNKPWSAFDPDDLKRSVRTAYDATQQALNLSAASSAVERSLIEALSFRYQAGTAPDELARWNDDFAVAMRETYRGAQDDLDVATIFAEALMNRTPWQLWNISAGIPAEGADTEEAVAVLERAMKQPRGMQHPGLLHMYVHAMEMSPFPERAVPAANALRDLVPDAGHLRHMPTHIDVLVGDYQSVIRSNEQAINADSKYLERAGALNFYSLYRCHNFHFKIYGAMFAGRYGDAISTADELISTLPGELLCERSPPMADWLEGFVSVKQHVLIRFGKWSEITAQELPGDPQLFCVTTAMVSYAKAVAHGVLGDVAQAKLWAARFEEALARVPPSRMIFNNRCIDILAVARQMMLGEIAYREGLYEIAFRHLGQSVELDDALPYDEPWGWMQPTRHALGALLLEQGQVDEAEAVYRADLGLDPRLPRACWHPENIWSVRGLHECLVRRGQFDEAKLWEGKLAKLAYLADQAVNASCYCRKTTWSADHVSHRS